MSEFTILGGEDYVPFITDIKVFDLGQTCIIYCTGAPHSELTYRVICLRCEKIELNFNKKLRSCIGDDASIDLVEFSIGKEDNKKKFVYLYGRVVSLELVCEKIKLEKDW